MTITVGDYEIDETKVPASVVNRLLGRQIAHIFNNECASHVLGKSRRAIVGKEGDPKSVTEAMLETYRASHGEQIAEWEAAFCSEKLAAIYDGTLSVRVSRGPSRDPVESAMRTIARAEVTAVLKSNGAKWPKADETVSIGGQDVDGDTLIDRRLAHAEHGPRIRKLAERKVADDKRLAKAVADAAGGGLAELGL